MKTQIKKALVLSLLTSSLFAGRAFATEITTGTENLEATLGSAYHSQQEAFSAGQCIIAPAGTPTGKAEAVLNFSESMSEESASSEMGFSVGVKARFGLVKGGADSTFLHQSTSSSLSVSSVWQSTYTFPVSKLVLNQVELSKIGKNALADPANSDDRWSTTCGDEFVTEVTQGAKFIFSVRVDFSSEADKNAFSASFSLSGPVVDINSTMKQASQRFGRRTKVTVAAVQIGGDISKVTDIFPQTEDGRQHFLHCTMGDFDSCGNVILNAIKYASDTDKGFPSQLSGLSKFGPATLTYRTAPYTDLALYSLHSKALEQGVEFSRKELSDLFEHQFKLSLTAERLLNQRNLGTRASAIRAEKEKLDRNLHRVLLPVSEICYKTPTDCTKAVDTLQLEPINEKEFEPMSFFKYCEQSLNSSFDDPVRTTVDMVKEDLERNGYQRNMNCKDLAMMAQQVKGLLLTHFQINNDGTGGVIESALSDLQPLAALTNLEYLEIDKGRVQDIAPLANLENLQNLMLADNRISDLTPLIGLQQLVGLSLDNNHVVDVSPLAGLHKLKYLHLRYNNIKDVTSLTYFPELQSLGFRGNPITREDYLNFMSANMVHLTGGADAYTWN